MASTRPDISIVIPAHNEAEYIGACLESIKIACSATSLQWETIVVLNRCTDSTETVALDGGAQCLVFDEACIAAIRNHGIRHSSGRVIITIDADSLMHPHTVSRIWGKFLEGTSIAGDTGSKPERWSMGIIFSVLSMLPYLLGRGIEGGLFWFTRESFDAIGGFDEGLITVEDLDFGMRLKNHVKQNNKRYTKIKGCRVTTSCRKFDQFGDWYLLKNPQLVRRIFTGTDRDAADTFYYRIGRR